MADTAFSVLSDPALFRGIVSWASGWPALVLQRWLDIKRAQKAAREAALPARTTSLGVTITLQLWPGEFIWKLIWSGDIRTLEMLKKAGSWSTASRIKFTIRDMSPAILKGDINALRLAFEWIDIASGVEERRYWLSAIDNFPGHCGVLDELDKFVPLSLTVAQWISDRTLREQDDLGLLTWFVEKFGPSILPKTMIHTAAIKANIELVRYLHLLPNQELEPNTFAQVYQQLRLWRSENQTAETSEVKNDCAATLEFLLQHRTECHTRMLEDEALKAGDANTLEFVARVRGTLSPHRDSVDTAAALGFLDAIQVVARHGSLPSSTAAMNQAAANGHLDVVQFLHEWGFGDCTSAAMDGAAANGHLDVVNFLHLNRSDGCTAAAMDGAAINGHYAIVKYLHDSRTEGCSAAAFRYTPASSPLSEAREILLFLLEKRTELHPESLEREALTHCDKEILFLIQQTRGIRFIHGVNIDDFTASGDLSLVQFLVERASATSTPLAMDAAAAKGHLHLVRYLHDHLEGGCTTAAMDMAGNFGHWDVVEFLDENRSEGCTSVVLNAAVRLGRMDLVQRYSRNAALMTICAAVFVAGAYDQSEVKSFLERRKHEMLLDLSKR